MNIPYVRTVVDDSDASSPINSLSGKFLFTAGINNKSQGPPTNPSLNILLRRNFVTREVYYRNLTAISNPDPVRRIRFFMSAPLMARTSKFGQIQTYRLHIRWLPPEYWNDNLDTEKRFFELRCEVEDEESGMRQNFLSLNVDSAITGYDENFVIRGVPILMMRCGMRTRNSYNFYSAWTWAEAKLHRVQIVAAARGKKQFHWPTDFMPPKLEQKRRKPSFIPQSKEFDFSAQSTWKLYRPSHHLEFS